MSKAFYKVCHRRLQHKLSEFGLVVTSYSGFALISQTAANEWRRSVQHPIRYLLHQEYLKVPLFLGQHYSYCTLTIFRMLVRQAMYPCLLTTQNCTGKLAGLQMWTLYKPTWIVWTHSHQTLVSCSTKVRASTRSSTEKSSPLSRHTVLRATPKKWSYLSAT